MAGSDETPLHLEAYFRQLEEMQRAVRASVSPAMKIQEQFEKSLQPIVESARAFQDTIESIFAERESLVNSILTQHESVRSALEQLHESLLELSPRTRDALILLGTHGWYMDLKLPESGLWKLKRALSEGNVTEAEDALAAYYEDRVDEIEESIAKRFPRRQKLISSAFHAYRRQEYELSIPVLLAQTDGICKELVNQYLFLSRDRKPRTAAYVEQFATDTYRAALLSPLATRLPLWAREHEREDSFSELNRHMVLHGDSLDYGTKTNCLKVISLINYVAHVLKEEP
ncbi:MAG: hypothetical protein ABII79_06070 [bacterium]